MGRPPAIKEGEIEQLLGEREKVALTTGDIAAHFDCHRKTAHKRLKKLEQQDKIECAAMSQADAWYLTNDPIVSMPDGGDLLPLRRWFATKLREFYPLTALTQAVVTALIAWYYAGALSALTTGVVVFLTLPAVILGLTYVGVKTRAAVSRHRSTDDSEDVAV